MMTTKMKLHEMMVIMAQANEKENRNRQVVVGYRAEILLFTNVSGCPSQLVLSPRVHILFAHS